MVLQMNPENFLPQIKEQPFATQLVNPLPVGVDSNNKVEIDKNLLILVALVGIITLGSLVALAMSKRK